MKPLLFALTITTGGMMSAIGVYTTYKSWGQ
jgi:hypothetical protein